MGGCGREGREGRALVGLSSRIGDSGRQRNRDVQLMLDGRKAAGGSGLEQTLEPVTHASQFARGRNKMLGEQ